MSELIFQISPDLVNSNSKIGTPIAFNRKYLVFVVDLSTIKAIEFESLSCSNAVLTNPHRGEEIKCLKLSHLNELSSSGQLLSCGPTSILLWNLSEVFNRLLSSPAPRPVGETNWFKFEIADCSFHSNNKIIGVSSGSSIIIIDVDKNVRLDQINLDGCINLFEFSLFHSNLILISAETNLLICYDFQNHSKLQEVRDDENISTFVDICGLQDEPIMLLGLFYR